MKKGISISGTRMQWLMMHGLLFVIVAGFFSPWWMGGRILAPVDILDMFVPWRDDAAQVHVRNQSVSDAVTQYLPYSWIAHRSLREDGYIGWNNLTFGGINQYANTMALYFDWTMQLHRWLDFWPAWHVGLMGQFLLAGCGMLVFLRSRGVSPWYALPGGIAYMGNFQFIAWIYHRWALGSFCWVPWLLWALLAWREGKRDRWPWIPIFMAMAFMGGTLQHSAFVAMVVAAVWIAWVIEDRAQKKAVPRLTLALVAMGLLGVALAAVMFVPCINAFVKSTVLINTLHLPYDRDKLGYSNGWKQPFLNLISYCFYCFPHPLGGPDTIDIWKGFQSDVTNIAYFGALPVLIAFFSLGRKDCPLEARVLIILGLVLPLTPLVGKLYHRVNLLFIVGGIWAFCDWLQYTSAEQKSRWANRFLAGFAIGCGIWLLASIGIWKMEARLDAAMQRFALAHASSTQFGFLEQWIRDRCTKYLDEFPIWHPSKVVPALAVAGSLLALQFTGRGKLKPTATGLALAVMLLVEIACFDSRWAGFYQSNASPMSYRETPELKILKEQVGDGTIYAPVRGYGHMPFPPNTLSVYGIRTLWGYESIAPDAMSYQPGHGLDSKALGKMGVTHLVLAPGDRMPAGDWHETWSNEKIRIYENGDRFPRYYGIAPGGKWLVSDPPPAGPEIVIAQESLNRRELRVPAGVDAVRIAENWSIGWKYKIDGREWQPAPRADDFSMLLPLGPGGTGHTVEMHYDRPLMRAGLFITMGGVFIISIAWGFILWRGKHPSPEILHAA